MSTEGERVVEVDCAPTQHAVRQAKRDLGGDVTDGRSDGCHQDGVEALEKSLAGEDHYRAAFPGTSAHQMSPRYITPPGGASTSRAPPRPADRRGAQDSEDCDGDLMGNEKWSTPSNSPQL